MISWSAKHYVSHKRCFKHAQCVFNWWVQMFVARLLTAVQDNLIRDEIVLSSCQKAWRARREDWSWKWRRRLRWHRGSNPCKPALHRVPGWQNAWRVKEGTVKMMAQHRCQEGITLKGARSILEFANSDQEFHVMARCMEGLCGLKIDDLGLKKPKRAVDNFFERYTGKAAGDHKDHYFEHEQRDSLWS